MIRGLGTMVVIAIVFWVFWMTKIHLTGKNKTND
jgi:hypothetical protein